MYFRVVNGALECLSRDLGIAENAGLQGKSSLVLRRTLIIITVHIYFPMCGICVSFPNAAQIIYVINKKK